MACRWVCSRTAGRPKSHPDPTGAQLKLLIPLLEAIVAGCDKIGGADFTWGILWGTSWRSRSAATPRAMLTELVPCVAIVLEKEIPRLMPGQRAHKGW
eukprot:6244863-Prymnesium_polylepis.1